MKKPDYLTWIIEEDGMIENCENEIKCYKVKYNNDSDILDDWALHIRRHYISDEKLKEECENLEIDVEEYLKQYIIPQNSDPMGGTARSNVITEILISDLLEFLFEYKVPRCRQENMSGKTVSEHGTDVIGYKFDNIDRTPSIHDKIIAAEVKAVLSKKDTSVVKTAVIDSRLDEFRVSTSLNYIRRKLEMTGKKDDAMEILRFQKKTQKDYTINYVAAGVTSLPQLEEKQIDGVKVNIIPSVEGSDIIITEDRSVFFVYGKQLMQLAHEVYERCLR